MRDLNVYNTNVAVSILVGPVIIIAGLIWFGARVVFLAGAEQHLAPIVSVSFEDVPQGKGSTKAYVPTIEIQNSTGGRSRVKVESSNKRPVYVVGEQLAVRCRLNTSSPECIEASIAEYLLYPSVAMLIGAGLLIGGLYMRRRADDSEMVSQNI